MGLSGKKKKKVLNTVHSEEKHIVLGEIENIKKVK